MERERRGKWGIHAKDQEKKLLDTKKQSIYNKKACTNRQCFCAQKYAESSATTDNITGGEKNANI